MQTMPVHSQMLQLLPRCVRYLLICPASCPVSHLHADLRQAAYLAKFEAFKRGREQGPAVALSGYSSDSAAVRASGLPASSAARVCLLLLICS